MEMPYRIGVCTHPQTTLIQAKRFKFNNSTPTATTEHSLIIIQGCSKGREVTGISFFLQKVHRKIQEIHKNHEDF